MFKKISSSIQYPEWVKYDERWKKLDLYDRLLDGTFYDHLKYAFYDEVEKGRESELIPIESRRPSAQYRLPRMVARWCARKLFADRHVPRIRFPDKAVQKQLETFAKMAKLNERMLEVAFRGSVGAVAATFRIEEGEDGKENIEIKVWKARDCQPTFNSMGDLSALRLFYIALGADLIALGAPGTLKATDQYWFIRDYLPDFEITYVPVEKDDWNPVEGFTKKDAEGNLMSFVEWEVIDHALGFVPAHWFVNLSGGSAPLGGCTWEDAIPNSIEIDYTLSQNTRGVRYNNAPQLVIKGNVIPNYEPGQDGKPGITRGPTYVIFLEADKKDQDGNVIGGADAKLLEMSGNGTKAALESIEALRKLALEAISASRKDPEKAKGPMSGRAMEYMDEEFHDLIGELRSMYGQHGVLPFFKKIVKALKDGASIDVSQIDIQWPRQYQPTPQDIKDMVSAFSEAMDPLGVQMNAPPAQPGEAGPDGSPGQPIEVEGEGPPDEFMLLTPEQARSYLSMNLDLTLLDIDGDEPDEPQGDDPNPPKNTDEGAPKPVPDGDDPNASAKSMFGMNIGKAAKVNA